MRCSRPASLCSVMEVDDGARMDGHKGGVASRWREVLIISKWGHVTDGSLVAYDPKEPPLFRPDGLEPDVHVRWWMPMLEDGWHTLKEQNHGGARGLDEGLVRSHL